MEASCGFSHLITGHRRLNAEIAAQGLPDGQADVNRRFENWAAGGGFGGLVQGIAIGVVLLEFIAEKSELVGPRSRIFPSDDSVDQSGAGRQALLREFGNNAPRELRPRMVGEPGNEARAGFAQIAKNRRVALAPIFDPDKTSLVDLDQPVCLGVGVSWLVGIEPIDPGMLNSRRKSGMGIQTRSALKENPDRIANFVQ
jgi:hypothetical protein